MYPADAPPPAGPPTVDPFGQPQQGHPVFSSAWVAVRPLVILVVVVVALHIVVLGTIYLVKCPPPWRFEDVPAPVELATMAYLRLVLVAMIMVYGMLVLSPFLIGAALVICVVGWLVRRHHRRSGRGGLTG